MTAQRSDYKVVFDLTSRDTLDQKNVVRWLTEISNANPEAKMEVVMYAKGLEMVVKDKSCVAEEIGWFRNRSLMPGLQANRPVSDASPTSSGFLRRTPGSQGKQNV